MAIAKKTFIEENSVNNASENRTRLLNKDLAQFNIFLLNLLYKILKERL
jgi:hypothetical protein